MTPLNVRDVAKGKSYWRQTAECSRTQGGPSLKGFVEKRRAFLLKPVEITKATP